ncbi:MAG: TolC family protein [Planctomycetes bacterium]|nr:TolC family protein [Planctomycetota bacterium]
MNRQTRSFTSLWLCVLILASGCQPMLPFFFSEDGNLLGPGDLSHYMDVATQIEYPDVHTSTLDEVHGAQAPLTLANAENFEMWDLTLEEVTRITLVNSQVIRQLGGRIADGGSNIAATTPETLSQNAGNVTTSYDPALVESGNGTATGSLLSGTGVEAALAEFDAQLDSSINWQNNDRPQNFGVAGLEGFFAPLFRQDTGNFTLGITKTAADGTTFEIRNNTLYDLNNNGSRIQPSDWFTNVEAAFTRPLLQGAGTQYNRIAGPFSFQQAASGIPNQIDGVIIARIRHDISLSDFEARVRDLMRDLEDAYWELQFAYRDLEARKIGRDSALETWRKIQALKRVSTTGGEADKEAQARSQYFLFRSQVETALTSLFRVENRLRYLMGLTPTDNRLIRPVDEPTTAMLNFDWAAIHCEALTRRTELRKQKWNVKKRELELIAARNHMLPRLDAVGRYRWLGAGDDLINSSGTGEVPFDPGSNAFEVLTSGNFQEWDIGLQLSIPIGFRQALTGVRHHQLLLARERAVMQDLELEISHQLSDAIRDVALNYGLTQTYFNRRVAAEDEVEAVEAVLDSGRVTLDLLLDAQRRRAESESLYYRALVDYNRAIMRVHFRKGSLLEYNGVYLAEGPWPGKAYFDALRRARQRDASTHLDYGFTRPDVISHGAYDQFSGQGELNIEEPTPAEDGLGNEATTPAQDSSNGEVIPLPDEDTTSEAAPQLEITPDDLAKLPVIDAMLEPVQLASHSDLEATKPPVAPVFDNPFRRVARNWSETSVPRLSTNQKPANFQKQTSTPHPLPTIGPGGQPVNHADESDSHYTPAGSAANPAEWQGTER